MHSNSSAGAAARASLTSTARAPSARPTSYRCGKCRAQVPTYGSFHSAWCHHASSCPGTGARRGYVRAGFRLVKGGAA